MSKLGVVIIGRNEGERLVRCLASVGKQALVVYVDSGSTDDSVHNAERAGAIVERLDTNTPFTAARARNAGYQRLRGIDPQLEFVQFIDGDCELCADWLELATSTLRSRAELAAVAGRRRERLRDTTIYNRLCDMEWDTPIGDTTAVGGDAMFRVSAFDGVQGFDETLIAGEEPELCLRLRRAGWRIERLDADMTWHDAAMHRFTQWWRRTVRAGHAFTEGAARHGAAPERHWLRESRSIFLWGCLLPLIALGGVPFTHGASLLLLSAYLLLASRIWRHVRKRSLAINDAVLYTGFTLLGKFPQFVGQCSYWWRRAWRQPSRLIEYKGTTG